MISNKDWKRNDNTRTILYRQGIKLAIKFCKVNNLPLPTFATYEEVKWNKRLKEFERNAKLLEKLGRGPTLGYGTGLYSDGMVMVNVPITALPVAAPGMQRWSWPCYKVDRTAVGVVAHELGHHVEVVLQKRGTLIPHIHGAAWRDLITKHRKRVTSYEPIPGEAWAESMRLFILNPALLALGCPDRYQFICDQAGLKPSERRPWRDVLGAAHSDYHVAGANWIAAR